MGISASSTKTASSAKRVRSSAPSCSRLTSSVPQAVRRRDSRIVGREGRGDARAARSRVRHSRARRPGWRRARSGLAPRHWRGRAAGAIRPAEPARAARRGRSAAGIGVGMPARQHRLRLARTSSRRPAMRAALGRQDAIVARGDQPRGLILRSAMQERREVLDAPGIVDHQQAAPIIERVGQRDLGGVESAEARALAGQGSRSDRRCGRPDRRASRPA